MADRVDGEEAVLLDHPNGLLLEGKQRPDAHHNLDIFSHLNYNHSLFQTIKLTSILLLLIQNSIRSYQCTEIAGYPHIRAFNKLILVFDVSNAVPALLDEHFDPVAGELVLPHFGFAGVPANKSRFSIALDGVLAHEYVAIIDEHDSVASVIVNLIVLDVDDGSNGHDAVVVAADLVLGDEELLAVEQENALASSLHDLVVVDIVIDIVGALEDQIAVRAAEDVVLLQEGSRSRGQVHSVSEVF